jgi:hypothetical protein
MKNLLFSFLLVSPPANEHMLALYNMAAERMREAAISFMDFDDVAGPNHPNQTG